MAENLSVIAEVKKASDARASWTVPIDFNEDIIDDTGSNTFTLAASGTKTITPTADSDFLLIKTPKTVTVTLTLTAGTFSVVPVRAVLLLNTDGLSQVQVVNPSAQNSVLVSVAISKRKQ